MRYRLLTYLYSSMHLAHSHGGTLARPLFFTDPADAGARWVCLAVGWSGCSGITDALCVGLLASQGQPMGCCVFHPLHQSPAFIA